MAYLIVGLCLFLGVHSVRIFADDWRTAVHMRIGEQAFKGIYSVLSLLGLGLIVWGFGIAREIPVLLWLPPLGLRHAASLLNILAFVFVAAAYVPGNAIKSRVHHPMVLGVMTWALAHLLANGNVAHVLLFGAFLIWAVLDFISACRRNHVDGLQYPVGSLSATFLAVGMGVLLAAVFAVWLHGILIGVKPFSG